MEAYVRHWVGANVPTGSAPEWVQEAADEKTRAEWHALFAGTIEDAPVLAYVRSIAASLGNRTRSTLAGLAAGSVTRPFGVFSREAWPGWQRLRELDCIVVRNGDMATSPRVSVTDLGHAVRIAIAEGAR